MTPDEALAHLRKHHVTFSAIDGSPVGMNIQWHCPDIPAPMPPPDPHSLVIRDDRDDMTHVITVFADLFAD